MIRYTDELHTITPAHLEGFFAGWPTPPSPQTHLKLLQGSSKRVVAIDSVSGSVVGFVTAITDGALAAYIPLLEVLPSFQGQGIGSKLIEEILAQLKGYYMIDVICDEELTDFYKRFNLAPARGMILRNYAELNRGACS